MRTSKALRWLVAASLTLAAIIACLLYPRTDRVTVNNGIMSLNLPGGATLDYGIPGKVDFRLRIGQELRMSINEAEFPRHMSLADFHKKTDKRKIECTVNGSSEGTREFRILERSKQVCYSTFDEAQCERISGKRYSKSIVAYTIWQQGYEYHIDATGNQNLAQEIIDSIVMVPPEKRPPLTR